MARETDKAVVDASVIVKWFLEESGSDRARALRDAHLRKELAIIVPELTFLEVLNTLRFKSGPLERAARDLWNDALFIEPLHHELLQHACVLALEHDLTLYDAVYLAIARKHDCTLFTADTDFAEVPGVSLVV